MDQSWGTNPPERFLRWRERPRLARPVLVLAFEGWNDAGDAATAALGFLHDRWEARLVADVDPEEFYDFTVTRPRVHFDDGVRRVVWPANELSVATIPTTGRDVVLFRGVEPQLRWRTYCQTILDAAATLGVELVVTLGALLAEVPHTRPVSVLGAAYDPEVADALNLAPSHYEGPTGIVGVVHAACQDAGIASASLWAAVPTYVPGAPSPKAALALLDRVATLLDATVDGTTLELDALSYEREVSDLVAEDEETSDYVASLEQRYDDDTVGDPEALVEQVERFLRGLRD